MLTLCVYTALIHRALIHRMIMKQLKIELIIRKQTCSLCFVDVCKFQEKFKIVQKNLQEMKIIFLKRFVKAIGHNDHYMINTGGQSPKIGSN